jgi:hypothetical protein
MTLRLDRSVSLSSCAAVLLAAFLAGCGGSDSSPTTPQATVLLDTSLTVVAGVTCNTGGVSADFNGTSGRTVVITATGPANLTPQFTLYAPDFATQLRGSTSTGAGAASLTFALTQTGVHHVTLCDANAAAGAVRVVVTQQP